MNYTDLKKWKSNWENVDSIYLWGYGKMCKQHLEYLKAKIHIEGIIDNDRNKTGYNIDNIPILHPNDIELVNKKIVITAPSTGYEEICEQLTAVGLDEYDDFCNIMLFVSAMAWFKENQVVISTVHISITTACTLNCKYCNMYMPFHKGNAVTYSFEQVKEQIDILFTKVDKVIDLELLGGEPMVNKELSKIITYIYSEYHDRVNIVSIVTNGTIVPNKELVEVMSRYNVVVNMSNYRLNEHYNKKFDEIKNILNEQKIDVVVYESLQWKNFSFPYEQLNLSDEQAYVNMCKCNPVFKGFNDFKLYFCHLVWSADKAGICKEQKQDYIDFRDQDEAIRENIVMMNICCFENNYVSLCKHCGGCSNMNQKYISVGEQV